MKAPPVAVAAAACKLIKKERKRLNRLKNQSARWDSIYPVHINQGEG